VTTTPNQRDPYPVAAALTMARASKRLAEKYEDEGLAKAAADLEARALDAIARGEPYVRT
jgi:hypothetical protein